MYIVAKGNSMIPTLIDGKSYRMELIKDENIQKGDIIVYSVNEMLICHRVIGVLRSRNDKVFIKTKGDNCIEPDPYAITLGMVLGKIVDE